ncbi:cytochrome c oxidase assembly protein [Gracilibacillus massiliensis]|uniref:cytochrome c oxidase assembly protein n=1 Tax=Gracilibacillus massiliensis TaxID=1564956 RepID=UPI00071C45F4|nr:cytochrome c oxidase assembly protein [Gracilibacillus massiliensis]
MHNQSAQLLVISQILLTLPFLICFIAYVVAHVISHRKRRSWPIFRTALWTLGSFSALISVIGPLAERAHSDFLLHMVVHLLLGMVAPLLMVLAAPITLILRALPIHHAKIVTSILRSSPFRVMTDPLVTAILNIGGLWLLYTTNLFVLMHQHLFIYVVVHIHIFLAGYIFTASLIYIDPLPHRTSYLYRSIILIAALAGHGILAKFIYANPPIGIPSEQAEQGSMLMFYGGDIVDVVIIFILCLQWYRQTKPRETIDNNETTWSF